jgi:hypothetical protein
MTTKPKRQVPPEVPAKVFPKPAKSSWKTMVPIWIILFAIFYLGVESQLDARILAATLLLYGTVTSAFAWLLGILGAIPLIGMPLLTVLSLPFIWLLNAMGYLVAFIAIRRGYSQDVLTYRGITLALIIGIAIGYVLGRLL